MRIVCKLAFLFALMIASCKKDPGEQYTISGKFTKSCDDTTPITKFNLVLYEDYPDAKESKNIATATTNERGEFTFKYYSISIPLKKDIGVSTENGKVNYLYNLPKNQDLDVNIYSKDNYFYIIKIKTDKPYTNSDTLFYLQNAINKNFILGPFYDNQVLDTVVMTAPLNWHDGEGASPTTYLGYYWKLGSEHNTSVKSNIVKMDLIPCKKYNEVVFDLTKL